MKHETAITFFFFFIKNHQFIYIWQSVFSGNYSLFLFNQTEKAEYQSPNKKKTIDWDIEKIKSVTALRYASNTLKKHCIGNTEESDVHLD